MCVCMCAGSGEFRAVCECVCVCVQGVESLQKAYQEQPDFTDDKGADDVTRQLFEVMILPRIVGGV